MSVSLQADSTLPQGYILVDGQRVASVSTTGGLSATLAANTVTTSSLVSGSVTTEKIAPGAVVTADLADGAVTAAKMAGGQTGSAPVYGCRAWVNFNGSKINNTPINMPATTTISVTAGNDFGFWNDSAENYNSSFVGVRYKIPTINGVAGGLLGGVDVSTLGVQFTEVVSTTRLRFRFLSGQVPNASTSITGNNTSNFTIQALGIREAGNVSSVFRNNTGDYTINFTIPMPDANYTTSGFAGNSSGNAAIIQFGGLPSVSATRVSVVNSSFVGADRDVSIAIFR